MTTYTFADLPYAYDALEPVIDATTMQTHHGRHHKAYYDNFLAAIKDNPLNGQPLETIFAHISKESAALRNNAGGYYNHNHYWNVMRPNGSNAPSGALLDAINRTFGSLDACKAAFKDAGIKQFGSGWAWLSQDEAGKLVITKEPNGDNPLRAGLNPLVGIDVWEHAYYLDFQNRRVDHIASLWDIIDWKAVEARLK